MIVVLSTQDANPDANWSIRVPDVLGLWPLSHSFPLHSQPPGLKAPRSFVRVDNKPGRGGRIGDPLIEAGHPRTFNLVSPLASNCANTIIRTSATLLRTVRCDSAKRASGGPEAGRRDTCMV